MHILYINPIQTNINITRLSDKGVEETISLAQGDDFRTFPDTILGLVEKHSIQEIWTLLGPGAFTRMRIITLTLSSLIMSRGIQVKGCHFFDTINTGNPVLIANDREYIIRTPEGTILLIDKGLLQPGEYEGYGQENDFTGERIFIEYQEDWTEIVTLFEGLPRLSTLLPIYLKEPHITCSKKNI